MAMVIAAYLQDCEIRGMSPRSLPGYKSALKDFSSYLDSIKTDIMDVDKNVLKGYLERSRRRGLSQRTIELSFSVLSTFYEYLVYEGMVSSNPVPAIRKRYLRRYKDNGDPHERQLISVEDSTRMIKGEPDIRNKAILILLFKTGMRRNELITLDVSDVDLIENRIRLKPTGKRTNRTLFMDEEAAYILR
ncbi:MAG: site-specific integrase, partial [Methanothrix sp.]